MSIKSPRTICITGASSGIGAALAKAYAAPHIHLILTARHVQRLEQVAKDCQERGATTAIHSIDITDQTTLTAWLAEQDQATPIDLLIANAGCSGTQLSEEYMDTYARTQRLWDVHTKGTLITIHAVLPNMQQRRHGQIAIMSSINALIPTGSSGSYGAAKAALLHYGQSLRGQLKKQGIAVNVICPGWVNSALTDLNTHPMPFKISADRASEIIKKQLKNNKPLLIFPWPMAWVTWIYRVLPPVCRRWITAHT